MTTVLQVIPSMGAGGAEQACIDVAAGLRVAGHRALVASSGGARVSEILRVGGEHIQRPVHSKNPTVIITNALWLARFIRAQKIDVIHVRSRAPAWSAYIACRMTGCAFITTFHAAYKFSNPLKKFYNSVMAKADRIIAISHFIGAHIENTYGVERVRIRVIPRGIDLDKFTPDKVSGESRNKLRKAWDIEEGQPLILFPSRLSPIKGQAEFIEAMARLPYGLKNVLAIIVGDDQGRVSYRRELENLIAAHGLQARVRLVPHCADMPATYSLAALAVAPSLVPEGFGRVPVEAMAMGVPAIATDLGGFTETISPGETGWLVPPNDTKKLAEAITAALTQTPEQRASMTHKAQQNVYAHYDKKKMVADTLKVYEELNGVRIQRL